LDGAMQEAVALFHAGDKRGTETSVPFVARAPGKEVVSSIT
jgi:hypothetical protein